MLKKLAKTDFKIILPFFQIVLHIPFFLVFLVTKKFPEFPKNKFYLITYKMFLKYFS